MTNKYSAILKVGIATLVFTILHSLLFQIPYLKELSAAFYYQIPIVYLFFLTLSVIILLVLIKVNETAKDQLGYVFLLATSIKLGLSYVFLLPILNNKSIDGFPEKINFFGIFILYLAIEVFYTIRLLNNKQ